MCGPTCAAPEDVDMTCDDCVAGIQVNFLHLGNLVLGEVSLCPVMSTFANNDFQDKFWF